MAKESIKARQRKREKMVAQFADKRAALKAAGDYAGLDLLPKNASPKVEKPLSFNRTSKRIYEIFRYLQDHVPRYGIEWFDTRSKKGKLVNYIPQGWVNKI